jgi:hypothetical protein
MGIVLRLAHYSRASVKLKTDRSAALPRRASSSEKVMKCSVGIAPLAFQLLTAGAPTPASAAAAAVPPTASITSVTDPSIPPSYSRNMNMSSVHGAEIDLNEGGLFHGDMPSSRESIISRLRLLPKILGKSQVAMLEPIGCTPPQWSNYLTTEGTSKNVITWEVASDFKEFYGVTLDWIYCNDLASLPEALKLRVKEAEKAAKVAVKAPLRKRRRA